MRVEQIMTKQVTTCSADSTLAEAAQLMWDRDCGCLPVCSTDGTRRIVGMVTDRDICMSALFQGRALHDASVVDAMTRQVLVCRPGDSLEAVAKIMCEARIRRLPVAGDDEALVGMITLADLAREAAAENRSPTRQITETDVADTLAAICRRAAA